MEMEGVGGRWRQYGQILNVHYLGKGGIKNKEHFGELWEGDPPPPLPPPASDRLIHDVICSFRVVLTCPKTAWLFRDCEKLQRKQKLNCRQPFRYLFFGIGCFCFCCCVHVFNCLRLYFNTFERENHGVISYVCLNNI